MKYFLYADDYGVIDSKTLAINDAFCKEWIQAATIVVNMEDFPESVSLAEKHGFKQNLAFHLNLSRGRPLTEDVKKTFLCTSDGSFQFKRNIDIQLRYGFSRRAIRALRQECEAQMKRYRDAGFTSNHIDSHRWCLWNFPVWIAIRPLLKQYNFTTTRPPRGHLLGDANPVLRLYYRILAKSIHRSLVWRTDWSGCTSEYERAIKQNQIAEGSSAEVYVHPDYQENCSVDILYAYGKKKPMEEVVQISRQFGQPDASL